MREIKAIAFVVVILACKLLKYGSQHIGMFAKWAILQTNFAQIAMQNRPFCQAKQPKLVCVMISPRLIYDMRQTTIGRK